MTRDELDAFLRRRPAILAPMEDVSDRAFRAVCRRRGAELCVTEFVDAERLVEDDRAARAKLDLRGDEGPTAIQIYGGDPSALERAAAVAEAASPAFVDVNCGCWAPKVVRRGAGAAWLREPDAMIAMARRIVERVTLPVTVKTRIGWGDEATMPIVDLARRLEDAGVAAITVHCRTARAGYEGAADWTWAARVQEAVTVPVVVNGDVRSAESARRALAQTRACAVMIGRRAIEHPWVFREVRDRLDRAPHDPRPRCAPPTDEERIVAVLEHLDELARDLGERAAIKALRLHVPGYLRGVNGAENVTRRWASLRSRTDVVALLEEIRERGERDDDDATGDDTAFD